MNEESDLMSSDKTEERLKEIVELTKLYDVYGPLLSDHKKEIFESYVLDNYSLGEIAEQVGMSRQGVRDIVKRCSKDLLEYEDKLGFLKKQDEISAFMTCSRENLLSVSDIICSGLVTGSETFSDKKIRKHIDSALKSLSDALDRI